MPVLINPTGRYCIIDDVVEFEKWTQTPGFTLPTKAQEKRFLEERAARIQDIVNPPPTLDTRIYLATVSQGGKDGYGVASAKIIQELKKLGIDPLTHYEGQKIAILFHNPYSISSIESPYKIIYTMFESDKIPDDWVEHLEMANEVIVPSRWCQEVFAKAGIKTKVVPLGIDEQVFKFKQRTNKRQDRKDFVFLHYNAFNIRKGFPEVFKAFTQEFGPDEPVKMIFKTTADPLPLPITKDKYPNIEIIQGKSSEKELLDIIYSSDCFVFPSRGEGFAMTPLECMATGIPSIVPNAHGITEYFDPEYMYEVKVKETCPALYSRYKGMDVGKMVICDVEDLRRQMRYVYEHQDEVLEKGRKASEYALKYTFTKTAAMLKEIIDVANSKEIPENKVAWGDTLVLEAI
jgi:glycosyltransferase involved in cell wall biosynthesis